MSSHPEEPGKPAPPPQKGASRDRALAALQRMAKPQPKPQEPDELDPRSTGGQNPLPGGGEGGEGSATGFVGMLAKRQLDSGGSRGPGSGVTGSARGAPLPMAREIRGESEEADPVPAEPSGRKSSRKPASLPAWSRTIFPMAMVLALLLLAIGLWALGAVIYMVNTAPDLASDVHYPLISWSTDVGLTGGYTHASLWVARGMLLCLPVAIMLAIMGFIWKKRLARRR